MVKRFRRCMLHIGTEKTGTTTIQNFLALNRETLTDEGTLYTVSAGRGGSQLGFAAYAHASPWATYLGIDLKVHSVRDHLLFRQGLLDNLKREFDANPGCPKLLVSCEQLSSCLRIVQEIRTLKDLLASWADEVEVLLYLRRQDLVAVSHYSTLVRDGNTSPELFPESPDGSRLYYYDYEQIYNNWAQVFGEEALRVRLFEKSRLVEGDLLKDFCSVCGISITNKEVPVRANESLSRVGLDFILELNRQLPSVVDRQREPTRAQLSALIASLCKGPSKLGTRAEAQRFYERYRAGNDRLKSRLFPNQLSLFSDDYSEYPEDIEQRDACFEDAVSLAVQIWEKTGSSVCWQQDFDVLEATRKELRTARAGNQFLRGEIAMRNGKPEQARKFYLNALQLNPHHALAHFRMAQIMINAEEITAGLEHLRRARAAHSGPHPGIDRLCQKFEAHL